MSQKQSYPRKPAIRRATLSEVGRHVGISRERVRQFIAEGVFELLGDGRLDLDRARLAYIHRLRDRPAIRSAAEERVREARAQEIELRTAIRAKDLCYTAECFEIVDTAMGAVRMEMGSVPAVVTRDLPLRRDIERAINAGLTRAADVLQKMADKFRRDEAEAGATAPEEAAPVT